MKKIMIYGLLLTVTLLLPLTSLASGFYVHDEAQLMTEAEAQYLESVAEDISSQTGLDIVVLTVRTTGSGSAESFADDFYDSNGFSDDGILLLLSMQERDWYISTCGEAINIFTDYGIDQLLDIGLPYFSSGYYCDGFAQVLYAVPEYADNYHRGSAVDVPSRGIGNIVLVSVLIGAAVAGVTLLIMRSTMNSRRNQRSAADYMQEGSYGLRLHQDMFLFSQISKTPRQQNNSGGSSTHRSSGGRTHGGGGRKF